MCMKKGMKSKEGEKRTNKQKTESDDAPGHI